MASEFDKIKADKNLERDINTATNHSEIRELLLRSVERSGIAERDPVTGRFISTGDTAQRQTDAAAESRTYTRSVNIGGQNLDFTANDIETLEIQINAASEVYAHLENAQSDAAEEHTAAELETAHQRKLFNDTKAQLEFQRGEISVKDYLEKKGAVGDNLASQGVDIDALREQAQQHEVKDYEA